ncbi:MULTISPECIES: SDR family NAD(P)-dependent oxidoreductase [Rhizobium]|uniref:SDR family NAD(P)-dependent oxidoreductase n=1 Tax=Rhizobium changzhiense TaxID=2692317 RepID=A0A7Z0RJY9_9HYPH|nr:MULTISPECIES: SDR family NAD(P)-dependent oxidoreductase [Rhizobium]MBA5805745.1 SDR family NAD(P)-dependent oxidoreductase [Rhizobium changzhiense]MCV9943134.1 SDR family NAD(P)-dependent oxidoreductase [Rhizobium sp. BT-175]MCW0014956.1 SDR family NAD(P)-dependent oxidoreductase [Rhizobium sp. BT-226]NZD63036.1 SDR family NAD(P)-dependent oxidoreductase [Rhizobium changzhiense]
MRDFIAHPEHGIVWISGASSGIGRALALRLAGEGYKVAVTARSHEKLVELQAEANGLSGSIIVLDGDVTDAEDMEHVMASIEYEHGTLAMAILNAGVYLPVHAEDLNRTDFEKSFAVNLSGVVNCLLPAIRHMKAKGQGQIAIVSSVTGYGGLPTGAAYGATKAALINMAESLKFDLDKMGIRIQLVSPGFVDTPATRKNAFPTPALVSVEEAAQEIAAGLKSQAFEITFPKRFTTMLKLARLLPYSLYFALVNRVTGWRERPPSAGRHPVTPHAAE